MMVATPDYRFDSWSNALASLGSIRDKAMGVSFKRRPRLRREQLDALYEQHPTAARIVDRLPFDAFREGWELAEHDAPEGFDLPALMARLQRELHVDETLAKAVRWSRLYGGALIAMGVRDGRAPSEPLDIASASALFRPMVLAADDAMPLTYDSAFGSPTYRQVLSYQAIELTSTTTPTLELHHSRVLALEPIDLPLEAKIRALGTGANGWGPSVLERPYDDMARYGSTLSHATSMMYTASILYVKLAGLADALKSADGPETVRKILAAIRENLDALGLLGLDKEDEIGSVQHTMTGVHELIEKMREALAAAADMPKEILFNESPAGLNAGQLTGPQQIWYALVAAFQKDTLTPLLTRMLQIAFAVWGVPISTFKIKWRPLWTKSEETTSETAKRNAETDKTYIDLGVLSVQEVRQARFAEGRMGPMEIPQDAVVAADGQRRSSDVLPALEIVKAVASGDLPRSAGSQLLIAGGFSPLLLGDAGANMPGLAAAPQPLDVPEPDDALDIRDAAKRVGVPTATLTAAIRRGDLRYWGFGARRTVSMREIAELGRSHEAAA